MIDNPGEASFACSNRRSIVDLLLSYAVLRSARMFTRYVRSCAHLCSRIAGALKRLHFSIYRKIQRESLHG